MGPVPRRGGPPAGWADLLARTSRPGASPPARSRCGTRTSRSGAQAALDPHRAGAGGAGAPAGPGERHRRRQRHPAAERRRRPPRAQPRARGLATARRGDRRAHGDGLRRVAVAARRPDAAARRRVQRPHLVDRAPPGRVRAGPVGHARAARLARVVGGPHPPDPAGHARVAQAALVALGQAPDDAAWDDPLAPLPPAPALDRARQNAQWVRTHVVPWAQRRLRGTSSGDGRLPRRPSCCPSRSPTAERGRLRQRLPRSARATTDPGSDCRPRAARRHDDAPGSVEPGASWWSRLSDSNRRPFAYKASALPAELRRRSRGCRASEQTTCSPGAPRSAARAGQGTGGAGQDSDPVPVSPGRR